MKKIIDFLSAPAVNLFVGLFLFLWLGCCIWVYESLDPISAFYGGLFLIALDIFSYGFNTLVDLRKGKKNTRQDLGE